MARVYQAQGNLDLTLEYYAKASKIYIATLGDKLPSVGNTYNNMARVYQAHGNLDLTLEYYTKASKIYIATLGDKLPSVSLTYRGMAMTHEKKSDKSTALT